VNGVAKGSNSESLLWFMNQCW